MKFVNRPPCKECPWRRNSGPGWIGGHADPQEFIDMIQADVKFPCHMSVDQTLDPEEIDFLDDDGIEYCIGQLAATKLLCKLPRDPEHAAAVQQVAQTMPDILHPMKEFCPHHRMELLKGKTHVEEEQG